MSLLLPALAALPGLIQTPGPIQAPRPIQTPGPIQAPATAGPPARAADDGAVPAAMLGVWERTDGDRTEYLVLESGRMVRREGDEVDHSLVRHGPSGLWVYRFGRARALGLALEDGSLVLDGENFVRSDRAAPTLGIAPLALPAAAEVELDPARRDALVAELTERVERDQAVRRELLDGGTRGFSRELGRRMAEIDRENTAWMRTVLGEVGWFDAERFGAEAVQAAFLIVQHSGDLPLMLAARPYLERDLEAGRIAGGAYALLHDRLELNLGRPQVYGSQIHSFHPREGGEVTVLAPLVDPEGVDARRAAMGLEPLLDYVARLDLETVPYFEWPE